MPLDVLYEDPHLIAVAKPAGLLTQGKLGGEPSLETAVREHAYPGDPPGSFLGTVHRLDRPVSGAVVWAKTPKAARRLADQFARREVVKEYWAVVLGTPGADRGVWEDWLQGPDDGPGTVQVCRPGTPGGRRAVTRFERADAAALPEGCAFLKLFPETGRTHQLRVQAGSRGLAILGDAAYRSSRPFPNGIALHASRLTIRHPILVSALTFEAAVPGEWGRAGIRL